MSIGAAPGPPAPGNDGHRVAVIGGGWSGMAAAVELVHRGVPVTVFEAGKVLGGRARRVETGDMVLDNGLHILVGAYRETLRLIELVCSAGDAPGLLRMPLRLRVEPGFELAAPRLPAPLHLAAALAMAKGLSAADRLAALRFMLALRLARFRCDPALSVDELLTRHRQTPVLTRFLWAPLCISALNTRPAEASAQAFLAVLRDSLAASRAASDLLLPRRDFSALFPEPAARYVEARGGAVHVSTAVRAVHARAQGFEVDSSRGGVFRSVVLATDAPRAGELLASLPGTEAFVTRLRALEYRPIHSIYLRYPAHVRLPLPMIGFAGSVAQWAFDRGSLCGQHGLIGVVISASDAYRRMPHDRLAHEVHRALADVLPGLPDPLGHRVIAEKRATFACLPQLDRPTCRTPVPRLYLAGDYTASEYPATLEAAVRSGITCAMMIAKDD